MPQYNECSNINTSETTDIHSASIWERDRERQRQRYSK